MTDQRKNIRGEVNPTTPPPAKYRSELTEAGEQLVIPDCELDAPQTGAKQGSIF
jgi:hypothetical protein